MSVLKQEQWMYFIQWACSNLLVLCAGCTAPKFVEQVWELHRQSVFILMLDFSCQCWLYEPPWVWRQYSDFHVGKALMRAAVGCHHYPDLCTVCTRLPCFSTWAGLSAQHRALPCRLMNSGIPTPSQGSWSRLFAVQKNWKSETKYQITLTYFLSALSPVRKVIEKKNPNLWLEVRTV